MPLMYAENTLQMEWCLDCHRNPSKNLRPTGEIYNMAWEKPAEDKPVWCAAVADAAGVPTAQSVSCTRNDPGSSATAQASLKPEALLKPVSLSSGGQAAAPTIQFEKFTSQDELGHYLVQHYNIRTPKDLMSCEVCHR
jgi:hypothetical protein